MSATDNVVDASSAPFRLGDFEVRPEANELVGTSGTTRLPRLQMALLMRLVAHAGRPVAREALIADVWPRRGVSDEVLSRAIADLRNVLRDDARRPAYLETLPKVGYRLKMMPQPIVRDAPSSLPPAVPADAPVPEATVAPTSSPLGRRRIHTVAALLVVAAAIGTGAWLARRGTPIDTLRAQLAAEKAFASDVDAEVAPRFSPDGQTIAFAITDDVRARVVIRDRNGSTLHTIARDDGATFSPVFFADGQRIAYWFRTPSDCGIVERRLSDAQERVLVPCSLAPLPRFDLAPDGRSIVYATRPPERPTALMSIDTASGRVREMTRPEPGAGDDSHPRFSPDGRRIVFFRGNDSQREVHVMSVAPGATPVRATDQRGLSYGAAWLDGQSLLVAADWFGFRALNRVDLSSGQAQLVGARGARFPDVDRRGDIVHEQANYRANVWRIDLEGKAADRALWPSSRYTNQAVIAPDGETAAFISNRDGSLAPYVARIDGEARRLLDADSHAYMRPKWSRDGATLYAVAMPLGASGPNRAVAMDVRTGVSSTLALPFEHVWDVSPAGADTLIVAEALGQAARLYRFSPGDARLERLPLPPVSQFVVSGARLAYSQPQLRGLTLCTLPALDCRRMDVPIGDANRFQWTLSDRALWYADGNALVRVDLVNGRQTRRTLEGPAPIGTMAIAADERSVLLSREDRAEVDLMLAPR